MNVRVRIPRDRWDWPTDYFDVLEGTRIPFTRDAHHPPETGVLVEVRWGRTVVEFTFADVLGELPDDEAGE